MGRIVINETENKQTVVLNDSPEGVSGGYFDDEMIWHKLAESEIPENNIYVGKKFKIKGGRNTLDATVQFPLTETHTGGPASINGAVINNVMLTSSMKNVALHVIKSGGSYSDLAAVNNSGNIQYGFDSLRITLYVGIPEVYKDLFDMCFEEVME